MDLIKIIKIIYLIFVLGSYVSYVFYEIVIRTNPNIKSIKMISILTFVMVSFLYLAIHVYYTAKEKLR